MENYLSDNERAAIISFCANEVMYNAVKKVVTHTITHQGVLVRDEKPIEENWVFGLTTAAMGGSPTNEQLGADLSAAVKGLAYMRDGFEKLKTIRVELPKGKKSNPAL